MTFRYPSTSSLPTPIAASRRRLAIITDQVGIPNASNLWVGINASLTPGAFYYQNCWWTWGLAILNWPYELVAISSGSTRTCAQAASAFAAEVTAFAPQEIWICLGRNDMTSAATATSALTSIDGIITAALAINPNIPIKISTVIPGDNTTQTTAYQQASTTFNYGLKRRAQLNPTVQLIDMAAVLRDPLQANGQARSGFISGDTITPTAQTHYLMGVYWAADISNVPANTLRTEGNQDFFGTNVNSNQLVQNPGFLGSGGAANVATSGVVSGTIPANWAITATNAITATVGAITQDTTPYPRRWLPVTLSGTASGSNEIDIVANTMPISPSIITLGTTRMRVRCEIKTASLVNITAIELHAQGFTAGGGSAPLNIGTALLNGGQTSFPAIFTLEIPVFVPPVTVAEWDMYVAIQFATGTAPSGTVSIANPLVEVIV